MPVVAFSQPSEPIWPGPPYYSSEPAGLGAFEMNLSMKKIFCIAAGAAIGGLVFGRFGTVVGGLAGFVLCPRLSKFPMVGNEFEGAILSPPAGGLLF